MDDSHARNTSDLEKHAVELANLAIHFDDCDNLPAASYYYQVSLSCLFNV